MKKILKLFCVIIIVIFSYFWGKKEGIEIAKNDIKARYILINEVINDSFGNNYSTEQMNFIIEGININ